MKNLKRQFYNIVGRYATRSDIDDYINKNTQYNKNWCGSSKTKNCCNKLTVQQCNLRWEALENIASLDNIANNRDFYNSYKRQYFLLRGRDPTDFDVENRNVYRYVGCIKP